MLLSTISLSMLDAICRRSLRLPRASDSWSGLAGVCASRLPKHPALAALWPLSQPQSRSFAQLGVAAVAQLLGHPVGKSCFAAAGSRDVRLQRLCGGGSVAAGQGLQGDPQT
ncbi:hypothetical protein NDU88_002663 [Pleurodeles waltl]|uniref:Uncharacterized protein n=1 Tax=Pleurodeles waltl TaxID=8319 RepID=A0AAV7L1W4_PLEWA|nr:hypothetical protein NDU88_002663 [Pleurodeles waltl]